MSLKSVIRTWLDVSSNDEIVETLGSVNVVMDLKLDELKSRIDELKVP